MRALRTSRVVQQFEHPAGRVAEGLSAMIKGLSSRRPPCWASFMNNRAAPGEKIDLMREEGAGGPSDSVANPAWIAGSREKAGLKRAKLKLTVRTLECY